MTPNDERLAEAHMLTNPEATRAVMHRTIAANGNAVDVMLVLESVCLDVAGRVEVTPQQFIDALCARLQERSIKQA